MVGAERMTGRVGSDLGIRAAVGAALIVLALAALWIGGWGLWTLVTAIALLAAAEWGGLVRADGLRIGTALAVLAAALVCAAPAYWGTDRSSVALLLILALVLAMVPRCGAIACGIAYVGTAGIALLFLRAQPNGLVLTLWTLAIVWATDIGGYFAGRTFGGPRLAPRISPSKTWSGLAGGVVAAAIVGGVIGWQGGLPRPSLWLGALLAVLAQAGDLFESGMKRRAGVKDSGRILPGHGGVLDRVDGALPVAILVAALVANGNFQ